MLAWAMTIHKAQGLTMSQVKVSFNGMFENGQAYVALSRVRELSGLSISDFNESSVRVSDKVSFFYANIRAEGDVYTAF